MTGYGRAALPDGRSFCIFGDRLRKQKALGNFRICTQKNGKNLNMMRQSMVKSILERGRVRISISTVKNTEHG